MVNVQYDGLFVSLSFSYNRWLGLNANNPVRQVVEYPWEQGVVPAGT